MSFLRKLELGVLSHLYKNRTVRLAKRRTTILRRLAVSFVAVFAILQMDMISNAYIRGNEEQSKPYSFFREGPDPFRLTPEEWNTL
jgi:hypothetical protein